MSVVDLHTYQGHRIEVTHVGRRFEFRVYRMVPVHPVRPGVAVVLRCGPIIGQGTSVTKWNARFRARDMARRAHKRGARWPK